MRLSLVLVVLLTFGLTALRADDGLIEIPGGIASMQRLFGYVKEEPESFVLSVNRILLDRIRRDENWEKVEPRVRLVVFLELVRDLQATLSGKTVLTGKGGRKQLERLAEVIGYQVKDARGTIELKGRGGDRWRERRIVASALGWDLRGIALRLERGETVSVEVTTDQVPAPFPLALWSNMTGQRVTAGNALSVLARDQRLSLMLEGLYHVSSETAAYLQQKGLLSWAYRQAPAAFFRYGPAIEIRNGALVIPGGEQAAPAWQDLTGVAPASASPFLQALLGNDSRHAYVWHALSFRAPEIANYYVGGIDRQGRGRRGFLKKLAGRIDDSFGAMRHDEARGADAGFATFARSLPLTEDRSGVALPGGLKLWFEAMGCADVPTDTDGLQRLASRARQGTLPLDEFLLKILGGGVKVRGYADVALPRVLRDAWMFGGDPGLLTPVNVVLLATVNREAPAALRSLDAIAPGDPAVIRDYLRTVVSLSRLDSSPDTDLVVETFQGGVELLRILARADRVEPATIEQLLVTWSQIHRDAKKPEDVSAGQLDWLVTLASALPEAAADAPGRGPAEQALVAAMVARRDPQTFTWRGLDYRGERGRDLARRMAAHLERQQIPPLDTVLELAASLAILREACQAASSAAAPAATQLISLIGGLPMPVFSPPLNDRALQQRFLPVDRSRLLELLRNIRDSREKKLSRAVSDVDQVRRLLARELRPLLLAPTYVEAMHEVDNPLFDDPNLVRKHTAVTDFSGRPLGDSAWGPATVITATESGFGSHFARHLSGVAAAVFEFHVSGLQRTKAVAVQDSLRDQLWFRDALTTRWSAITPDVSRLTSTLVDLGHALFRQQIQAERTPGPASDLCHGIVSTARLERAATAGNPGLLSPGDFFVLGLETLGRDGELRAGGGRDRVNELLAEPSLQETLVTARAARDNLGATWIERLGAIGAPTPLLTGHGRGWVGRWPSYEELMNEGGPELLSERQLLDLHVLVADYLGRHGLPGEIGGDLFAMLVGKAPSELEIDTLRDWEGFIVWLSRVDESYLDERMRECFAAGRYAAQLF